MALAGESPYLLLGHASPVASVAISPDGRWVASAELGSGEVRLWPMPEGPPLQALPYEELLARRFSGWAALAERAGPWGCREIAPGQLLRRPVVG
jgi:WD40 repeat protein